MEIKATLIKNKKIEMLDISTFDIRLTLCFRTVWVRILFFVFIENATYCNMNELVLVLVY